MVSTSAIEAISRDRHQILSVVVTTSPIPTAPSTDVIDRAIGSLHFLGLKNIPLFIVADGVVVKEQLKASSFKRGHVTIEMGKRYEQYVANLHSHFPQATLLENPIRRGFARGVEFALSKITTPYVLIFQHDFELIAPVETDRILEAMAHTPLIQYIGIASNSSLKLTRRLLLSRGRFGSDLRAEYPNVVTDLIAKHGLPLFPIDFWYDSPHICRTESYRQIFAKRPRVTKNFIEDSWGHRVRRELSVHGLAGHDTFGCFILWSETPQIRHIHGRNITVRRRLQPRDPE